LEIIKFKFQKEQRKGRKNVYGIVLVIMVFCAFAQSMSFGTSANAVIGTLCFWRFILGVGVGGDYPLSATIMSEYSTKLSRGALVGTIFAMQGIGILAAAAVTAIVTACFDAYYPSGQYPSVLPCGCTKWSTCSYECQTLYYTQIKASCPPESDFVWRTVLAFGAFPALCTLYFRSSMPETPRYTQFVEGQTEKTAAAMAEATRGLDEALSANLEQNVSNMEHNHQVAAKTHNDDCDTFQQFLSKYGWQLLGTASTWFFLDISFYSQNLFQKDVFTQVGFIPPAKFMYALQETAQISKAQAVLALGSTIPGYWFTVFFVDILGRKSIQFMGFALMTIFMFAMAGSYTDLLNPNTDTGDIRYPDGQTSAQPMNRNGWIAMYAFCFFFANFGPNSTTFIVPAELFPTKWKSTGHGISAAAGKAGAIIGAFAFLFASQPQRKELTWDFPCDASKNELLANGACKVKSNCPTGRVKPGSLNDACDVCVKGALSGCYPYGIGVKGALFVLAGINCLGFLFTFLVPETNGKTLEDLNGEDEVTVVAEDDKVVDMIMVKVDEERAPAV